MKQFQNDLGNIILFYFIYYKKDVDVGPAPERQTAFNQIVVAIFSTLEQKRNYNLYCDSLEICRFPQRVSPPRDVYDAFIARTPRSVLTVPTIVDFMLKQVEHTVASAYENSCATSSLNQESQSLQEQELTAENIDDAKVTNDESASVDSAQTNVPDPRLAHFLDNQLAVFSSNGNQRSLLSSPYSNPNLSACHPQGYLFYYDCLLSAHNDELNATLITILEAY